MECFLGWKVRFGLCPCLETNTTLYTELDTFSDAHVIWRAFVTSAIAAVALQYVDPFGTSKLVLFQVCLITYTKPHVN